MKPKQIAEPLLDAATLDQTTPTMEGTPFPTPASKNPFEKTKQSAAEAVHAAAPPSAQSNGTVPKIGASPPPDDDEPKFDANSHLRR